MVLGRSLLRHNRNYYSPQIGLRWSLDSLQTIVRQSLDANYTILYGHQIDKLYLLFICQYSCRIYKCTVLCICNVEFAPILGQHLELNDHSSEICPSISSMIHTPPIPFLTIMVASIIKQDIGCILGRYVAYQ